LTKTLVRCSPDIPRLSDSKAKRSYLGVPSPKENSPGPALSRNDVFHSIQRLDCIVSHLNINSGVICLHLARSSEVWSELLSTSANSSVFRKQSNTLLHT
jgi:hypothetical protein